MHLLKCFFFFYAINLKEKKVKMFIIYNLKPIEMNYFYLDFFFLRKKHTQEKEILFR